MRLAWPFITLLLLLVCNAVNAKDLTGTWVGTFKFMNAAHPIKIELEQSQQRWTGKADLLSDGVSGVELIAFDVQDNNLKFAIQLGGENLGFVGKVKANQINGTVVSGSLNGTFRLIHLANLSAREINNLFGVYRLEGNEHIYVRTWDELGSGQLTAFHSDGRIEALHSLSSTQFFSGPGLLIPFPEKNFYLFQKRKHGMNVEYREGDRTKSGVRIDTIREIGVEIRNKQRRIDGSLVLPEGKGPFPGVVLVHGSGAVSRDFFGPIAYVFAQKGIAALTYDKRKDWLESSFEGLAEDASAAFRYLRDRPEIDSGRVGYMGASQGGWVAPLAATLDHRANFLILISGPSVSPAEHEVMRLREETKVKGASQEEINKAVEGLRTQLVSLRSNEALLELEKQENEWKEAGRTKELEKSGIENPRFLIWYRSIMDYDPLPVLRLTRIPVLAIYGEFDRAVPPQENVEPMRMSLKQAGNEHFDVRVLPRADHVLLESETGSREEFPHLNRFAPEFFELLTEWVLKLKPKT